ncbi:alpha/beta hydrolase [Pseudoalteromonas rubra]|uniref:Alpha/beta hydrolase n=1 Tax=Pseudoalteromonas rubra TaxID=43658 RepID=A0A5S3WW42_9GAMM|nr:alpha/beta hydrolase [Pseudoalteromonas rubra]TMP31697.1 alpha/beta hydrolase [Pseudoalteromonas rubra]TMP33221.1 alpha/beta hydrolase [Pseudoalteromonas rubra]
MLIANKNKIKQGKVAGYAYQELGEGKRTVLMLHGWQDNSNSFWPLLSKVSGEQLEQFRFIALDFPGHGQSNWRSSDAHYYFVEYVYDILSFFRYMDIERCDIVGHSMGALVGGLFTSLYQDKVESLTLIDGIGLLYQSDKNAREQLLQAFTAREAFDENINSTRRLFADKQAIVKARLKVSDFSEEIAAILMERNIAQSEEGAWLTTDPKLKLPSTTRFSRAQALSLLQDIETSTLAIMGTSGFAQMKHSLTQFSDCFKRFRCIEVSGGHHCHMESPEQVLGEILTHIKHPNLS